VSQQLLKWARKRAGRIVHFEMQVARILKSTDCDLIAFLVLATPVPNGILHQRLEHK
jgi:hypothetical protein